MFLLSIFFKYKTKNTGGGAPYLFPPNRTASDYWTASRYLGGQAPQLMLSAPPLSGGCTGWQGEAGRRI